MTIITIATCICNKVLAMDIVMKNILVERALFSNIENQLAHPDPKYF